jgi:hypothetical protein
MMVEASKHATKIKQSTEAFPRFDVTNDFPHRE